MFYLECPECGWGLWLDPPGSFPDEGESAVAICSHCEHGTRHVLRRRCKREQFTAYEYEVEPFPGRGTYSLSAIVHEATDGRFETLFSHHEWSVTEKVLDEYVSGVREIVEPNVVKMPHDEFWEVIQSCRAQSADMPSFNRVLEQTLHTFDRDRLVAFHNTLWIHVGIVNGNAALSETLFDYFDFGLGDDTGDCYGGWVVAQGRDLFHWLMLHPTEAHTCFPGWDDVFEGESVFFSASRVWLERTGDSLGEIADSADAWIDYLKNPEYQFLRQR